VRHRSSFSLRGYPYGFFLRVPEQREIDPFSQGLGGELWRLVTYGNRLDNSRGQERQPHHSSDVPGTDALSFSNLRHGLRSTRQQILRPLTRSGDGFQERRIGSRGGRAIACDDQTHLDTAPPDCHWKEAHDDQPLGVRQPAASPSRVSAA